MVGLLIASIALSSTGCTKQARTQRSLERAEKSFAAGDYDRAEIECQKALKASPNETAVIKKLGLIYFIQGRMGTASAFLQKAVDLQPADIEARLKLGMAWRALGRAKDSRAAAVTILSQQPNNEEALLLLSDTSISPEEIQDAGKRLESIPIPMRSTSAYCLSKGFIAARSNDLETAEEAFKQAASLDPKSDVPQLALANLYMVRNDKVQAEAAFKAASALAPLRSQTRIAYADFKLKNGQSEAAKSIVREITTKAPDFVPAWTFLARVALAECALEDCAAALNTILSRDPADYEALVLEGKLMLAKGEAEKATVQFERIIKTFGPSATTHYSLALAQLQNRQETKAMASLDTAVKLDTNYSTAILLLSDLNLRRGAFAEAANLLQNLIQRQPQISHAYPLLAQAFIGQKQIPRAATVYLAMVRTWPNIPEICLEAGNGLARINRPDEAVSVYAHIAITFTNNPQAMLVAGRNLLTLKRENAARQVFQEIARNAPAFMPALEELIELDLGASQPDAALARAKSATDANPKEPVAWLLLAKVHIAKAVTATKAGAPPDAGRGTLVRLASTPAVQQEAAEAESAILKAMKLDPGLPASYDLLARLYVAWNKDQQALDQLNSLTAKTNHLGSFLQIGMIQEELGNYPAAAQAYEKALASAPKTPEALIRLAWLSSEHLNKVDHARELAEEAARLQPQNPQVMDTLGWIAFRNADYKRALSLCQESVKNDPGEPRYRYHLGMAHYMLGNENPARIDLEHALTSAEPFPGREDAQASLDILTLKPQTDDPATGAKLDVRLAKIPNDPVALIRRGELYENRKAFDKAIGDYETALKHHANTAAVRFKLASLYAVHLNDTAKALDLAKQAHEDAPEDVDISRLLGRLLLQKGDTKWAIRLLEECLQQSPEDTTLAYELAQVQYLSGQISEATSKMQMVEKTSGAEAERARQFLLLVGMLQDTNRLKEGVDLVKRSLAAEPGNVPALMASASLMEIQGDYAQAAATYNEILQPYPDFAPATRSLALVTFEHLLPDPKADDSKLYSLATRARSAFPDDPSLARILGVLNYRRGGYPNAVRFLKESARHFQNDAELLCYLGLAQYKLKERADAKATLQKAAALQIPPHLAAEVEQSLAELQ